MSRTASRRPSLLGRLGPAGLAIALLLLGGLVLAGPYGLFAWGEQNAMLDQREARIALLEAERATLANRVERLDPERADPDLVTELLRRDLNVAHPDEYVVPLSPGQ